MRHIRQTGLRQMRILEGTTNRQDVFAPCTAPATRRSLPVTVYPERAEVHILDDEAAARALDRSRCGRKP